ncbi:MAG TPA: hypothetical protein VF556_15845 [Pyrinomonadaceae bacterium]|jgi:hypothetical protein
MSYDIAFEMKAAPVKSSFVFKTANSKIASVAVPLVFLILLSGILVFERLSVPQMPISPDSGAYAVISNELLHGKSLYTDIWDHKPPAIFVTNAMSQMLLGYSTKTVIILNLFVSLVVLFGLFYAGKAGPGGTVSGLLAATLWVIVSGVFVLEGRDPNTEIFLNACLVWAFAILARNRKNGLSVKHLITIGLLLTIGSFYKPVIIANALFLMGAHIIFPPDANRKKALTDAFTVASIGAIGWIFVFAYFAATNRFEIFYQTIVSYNSFYSGNLLNNFLAPIRGRSEVFLDFMNPLAGLTIAGVLLVFFHNRRQATLLAAFVFSTWLAVSLPGHFFSHYFQLWLPPLIVGASWAIGSLAAFEKFWLRFASFAAAVLLIGILIVNQFASYQSAMAEDWSKFVNPPLAAGSDTARKINELLQPEETFFLWGNTPNLYLLTNRRPPAAIIFQQHLLKSPVSEQLTIRVQTDLERERPEMLVAEIGKAPVPEWIVRDYEIMPIPQSKNAYTFYMRRGGRLATQFDSAFDR